MKVTLECLEFQHIPDVLVQNVEGGERLVAKLTRKSVAAPLVRDYDPNRQLRVLPRYRRHRRQRVSS